MDSQVVKNVVGRYFQAAKGPQINAINRAMRKLKPAIAEYLSSKTDVAWQPSNYIAEKNVPPFLISAEHSCYYTGPKNQQWKVTFQFSPAKDGENYEMVVMAMKGQRILDSFREEKVNLETLKPPAVVTNVILKALKDSLGGDYGALAEEVVGNLNEVIGEATQAIARAKVVLQMVNAGKFEEASKSKELRELSYSGRDIEGNVQYVEEKLKTIVKGE